jgi:5-methylcytosine-specific restriction endonuclease McrA
MKPRPFEFTPATKDQAFQRQWNRCAHCESSLIKQVDHAHHVVPNQAGNPRDPGHAWLRSALNCVLLCEHCHERVHENGRYRNGAVALPEEFKFSHGKDKAAHAQWVEELNRLALLIYPNQKHSTFKA